MTEDDTILSSDEARLLDRMTIAEGSGVSAAAGGVRRTRARGTGIEFHDYRPYQPGDDPRTIDWTVEARLRQLVVRAARAQGHLRVHVLLDASASMQLGRPSKFACARRLAAALCYIAIEHRDAAGVATFGDRVRTRLLPAQGPSQLFRALQVLDFAAPGGPSAIGRAVEEYAAAAAGPGLVPVLSDFFEPGAGLRGLQYLLHRGLTPAVLQVVAEEEVSPELVDDSTLVDVEDEGGATIAVDRGVITAYQRRLAEHDALLRDFCVAHRCPWARLRSDMTFREQLAVLQAGGIVDASM